MDELKVLFSVLVTLTVTRASTACTEHVEQLRQSDQHVKGAERGDISMNVIQWKRPSIILRLSEAGLEPETIFVGDITQASLIRPRSRCLLNEITCNA